MSRSPGAARALADPAAGSIVATVEIAASPERIFAALTTPEVAQWWGSADTYRIQRWQMDLRVGGKWRSEGVSIDGHPFTVHGEVLELDPPRLLTHSWQYDWDGGGHTVVRYEIQPLEHGARVTVRHTGFPPYSEACKSHGSGWERVLGWLSGHLDSFSGAAR
jgi:Uncharacterized conserved protein